MKMDVEIPHCVVQLNEKEERGKRGVVLMTPTGRRLRANTQVSTRNHWQTGENIEITTNDLGYRGPTIGSKWGTR